MLMGFMDSKRKVWINGQLLPESEAKVPIYDSALMFGDTVFEMTRSFNKDHFLLNEHIDRLIASAEFVEIKMPYSKDQILDAIEEVTEYHDNIFTSDDEHRLMINLTRGLLGIYENNVDFPVKGPILTIANFPLKWTVSGMSDYFSNGIHAVVSNQKMIPDFLLNAAVKNRSRLHYMMANIDVSKMNLERAWALLEDLEGNICEGTGSNIFFVRNNEIFTPKPKNMLRGISRQYVIDLARKNNIKVYEEDVKEKDFSSFSEAFFTATPFCMVPCLKLNDHILDFRPEGGIYNKILSLWSNEVGVDIEKQIANWNKEKDYSGKTSTPYKFKN
tara:strand:- start:2502 stop:3494 length:993 start_codon:yes stop_codon:yes gene_type:complete